MQQGANLFIIGFQKCGSSSLFGILESHPDIQGAIPKETFFLSDTYAEDFNADYNISNPNSSWSMFFDFEKKPRYFMDGSVNNFYQKTAKKIILNQEDVKIIFILRDPIERFISNYKYYKSKLIISGENVTLNEYIDFITVKGKKFDAIDFALDHGQYAKYISEWEDVVERNKILIVGLKELNESSIQFKNKLGSFLGIDYTKFNSAGVLNSSKNVKFPLLHRFIHYSIGGSRFPLKKQISKLYKEYFYSKNIETLNENNIKWLKKFYKQEYAEYSQYF